MHMIGYLLIGVIFGGLLGYGIAYARFGDAKLINELRSNYKELQHDLEVAVHETDQLQHQNAILKQKAQELLDKNDDYVKIVSELSRYYYHIQRAKEKIEELSEIVEVVDGTMEKKLITLDKGSNEDIIMPNFPSDGKKFF